MYVRPHARPQGAARPLFISASPTARWTANFSLENEPASISVVLALVWYELGHVTTRLNLQIEGDSIVTPCGVMFPIGVLFVEGVLFRMGVMFATKVCPPPHAEAEGVA